MRKLVLKMSVSADGFVGGPNGEMDWMLRTLDAPATSWIEETLWQAGLHIMGSRTFHDMASYWPTSSKALAAPMNEIPKMVFSRKGLTAATGSIQTTQALKDTQRVDKELGIRTTAPSSASATWNQVPVGNDLIPDISRLKQENGKFILAHGGAGFAQELVKSGLIDEYRLVIHPVILGQGLPLFALSPLPVHLTLRRSMPLPSGIVANVYSVNNL